MITELKLDLPESGIAGQRILSSGRGHPIVMLHGNPDTAEEWRPLMTQLGDAFHCIAPDMPGYGTSAALPKTFTYTVREQTSFVDEVLDALGVTGKVTLVLHDIGAMMGVPWAAAHRERLRGVVVTNTVAFEGFSWFPMARLWGRSDWLGRAQAGLLMKAIGLRKGARFRQAFAAQNPQLSDADLDRMTHAFALSPSVKDACLRQFRQVMAAGFFDGFDQMNRSIAASVPVHVVWGQDDPYIPDRYADAFFAHAVTRLPAAGHWPALVAPEAIAEAVRGIAAGD
ncbi:MAG: alpha/beta hydrolase [Hyphomonas sp.]